jgi:hypothetical protein
MISCGYLAMPAMLTRDADRWHAMLTADTRLLTMSRYCWTLTDAS